MEDEYDIRPGDVFVSKPSATFGGVVQYDMGKVTERELFQRVGSLSKPPPMLKANAHWVEAQQARIGSQIPRHLWETLERIRRRNLDMSNSRGLYQVMHQPQYIRLASHRRVCAC